jgi:23S rRNA (cytidine1920-2'-O)/16S rRNA (cytidine1409-2'-O)-methyltransferase
MAKKRLDELLVEKNLAVDVDKAKRLVMAGLVFSEQLRLDKPGMKLDETIPLRVKTKNPYVGRGGLKMEKALKYFSLTATGKTFMDIGSSTGGFTDCALQHGARLSYAIDVGYNQLDWTLRNDDRVVVMERTNFRHVTEDMLKQGKPDLAAIDVSFISLELILPVLKQLLKENSDVIALIKPQFEARKEEVGERGIVRDKDVHRSVLNKTLQFAKNEGFEVCDLTHSPITGSEGNLEFLAYLTWKTVSPHCKQVEVQKIVDRAHAELS